MVKRSNTFCQLLALLVGCGSAWAEVEPLAEDQLAQVWGQAALSLTNTQSNGMDFSRITFNADINISANVDSIAVGAYENDVLDLFSGTGVAVDIGALQLGRSDGAEADRLVSLTNPYIEFVYEQDITAPEWSKVLGMRLGFEGVSGDIGTQLNIISGAIKVDLGNDLVRDSLEAPLGGLAWGGLADIGLLQAGSAEGPSRDFFVSALIKPVTFPTVNGVSAPPSPAGIWLNWRDRLSGSIQPMPPNQSKGLQ